MRNKSKNIPDAILEPLKVKCIKTFTNKFFNGYPHRYDLLVTFALSAYFILEINIIALKFNCERNLSHIRSLKADDDAFKAFLTKQPCYTLPVPLSDI